jgi:hypothetical protein
MVFLRRFQRLFGDICEKFAGRVIIIIKQCHNFG